LPAEAGETGWIGAFVVFPSTTRCARAQDEAALGAMNNASHPEQRRGEAAAPLEGRTMLMQ
jgi:hypothetical protein